MCKVEKNQTNMTGKNKQALWRPSMCKTYQFTGRKQQVCIDVLAKCKELNAQAKAGE
jgi:hypothetical protein